MRWSGNGSGATLKREFDHKDGKGRGGRDGEADRLRDMHRGFLVNAKLAALDRGDGMQMDGGR